MNEPSKVMQKRISSAHNNKVIRQPNTNDYGDQFYTNSRLLSAKNTSFSHKIDLT